MSELLNGWRDISEFTPDEFPDRAEFQVWIIHPDEGGSAFMAKWGGMTVASPDGGDPVHLSETFVGEWRAMEGFEHLEPFAFKEILPPYVAQDAQNEPLPDAA